MAVGESTPQYNLNSAHTVGIVPNTEQWPDAIARTAVNPEYLKEALEWVEEHKSTIDREVWLVIRDRGFITVEQSVDAPLGVAVCPMFPEGDDSDLGLVERDNTPSDADKEECVHCGEMYRRGGTHLSHQRFCDGGDE